MSYYVFIIEVRVSVCRWNDSASFCNQFLTNPVCLPICIHRLQMAWPYVWPLRMLTSSVYLNSRSSLSEVIIFMEHFTVKKLSSSNSYFNSFISSWKYAVCIMALVVVIVDSLFVLSFIFSSSTSCQRCLRGLTVYGCGVLCLCHEYKLICTAM